MVKITGTYEGGLRCAATHGPSGGTLVTDAPKDNHGLGAAFSPTDLVATALATCVATTMALAARAHGVELGAFRYEVTKEMSAAAPRRIARLALRVWLPAEAAQLPPGTLAKAAHGCPVHRSLAPEVEMPIEFVPPTG
jgi:putative redox protein